MQTARRGSRKTARRKESRLPVPGAADRALAERQDRAVPDSARPAGGRLDSAAGADRDAERPGGCRNREPADLWHNRVQTRTWNDLCGAQCECPGVSGLIRDAIVFDAAGKVNPTLRCPLTHS